MMDRQLRQLVRLVERTDVRSAPRTGAPIRFDRDRIYFKGHSQGSQTGPPFIAFEPSLRAAVLSGAGANLVLAFLGKRKPIDVGQVVEALLGETAPIDEFHPFLSLLQTYFEPADPEPLRESRFPIWIWMDDPSFYGFPYLPEAGCKVGQDVGGREVTARTRAFDADPAALQRVRAFVERVIPPAAGDVRSVKTCLYTLTPDRGAKIGITKEQRQAGAEARKAAAAEGKKGKELQAAVAKAQNLSAEQQEAQKAQRELMGKVRAAVAAVLTPEQLEKAGIRVPKAGAKKKKQAA